MEGQTWEECSNLFFWHSSQREGVTCEAPAGAHHENGFPLIVPWDFGRRCTRRNFPCSLARHFLLRSALMKLLLHSRRSRRRRSRLSLAASLFCVLLIGAFRPKIAPGTGNRRFLSGSSKNRHTLTPLQCSFPHVLCSFFLLDDR
jgi:hypothetical protein